MRPAIRTVSLVLVLAASVLAAPLGCVSGEGQLADVEGVGGGSSTASGGGCVSSAEVCDGVDNDCNGEVDEGCACSEGDTQLCYTGDPAVRGIGGCQAGRQVCSAVGAWGPCLDSGVPSAEVCDGVDNDCDGLVDEALGIVTCGLGQCQRTVEACESGKPVPCFPAESAGVDACDGTDDDCDGSIDEDCDCADGTTQGCYPGSSETRGVGECADGVQICVDGSWGGCVGAKLPTAESCDGKDNDCDTVADEGDPGGGAACNTDEQGVCEAGTRHCIDGALRCVQAEPGNDEETLCDGLDDDCDGTVDEGNPQGGAACDTGLEGICAAGTVNCVEGELACQQTVPAAPAEICIDGKDDNCNGLVDEGCCPHDVCVNGAPLVNSAVVCDDCVAEVCDFDDFCCDTAWDSLCQEWLYIVCGSTQCGTCTMPRSPAAECGAGHRCAPMPDAGSPGVCTQGVGIGLQDDVCTSPDDCAGTHTCYVDPFLEAPFCMELCSDTAQCLVGYECVAFEPRRFIGATEWGVCF